jgi:hypothetical protein
MVDQRHGPHAAVVELFVSPWTPAMRTGSNTGSVLQERVFAPDRGGLFRLMRDHYREAGELLDGLDDRHRLSPAERVARAQVLAALAQAAASRAMVEVLARIADALDRGHPGSASGPSALTSRTVPRRRPPRVRTASRRVPPAGQGRR